jgi:hypothetical protein
MTPSSNIDPLVILFALAGAAVLGAMAWGLVEVTIQLFRRFPQRGLVIFGSDILHQKLTAAMKDSPPAFAGTEVIHVDEPQVVGRLREDLDRFGRFIPAEYPREFDPSGFCWPGFFFPYLWAFRKGLIPEGTAFFIIFRASLLTFNPLTILVPSIWCGLTGYMKYSKLLNSSSPLKREVLNVAGIILFGIFLLFPIWMPILVRLLS